MLPATTAVDLSVVAATMLHASLAEADT